jgi:hypothetical protein
MLLRLLSATSLLALSVVVHAAGMVGIFHWVMRSLPVMKMRFWTQTSLVVRTAWLLIAIHLIEIAVWALFYWWQRCLPDLESSFYFSGVTYTTVGYGDLLLPREWRLLGPVEGLTGILMCGLSTGFFFAMVSKLYAAQKNDSRP